MTKTEWIYFFEEPVRHQGLIEIGRTGRTVEDRNRDKRSVDPWLEIGRYPVADSRRAEAEIIKVTAAYRYRRRKEILKIDWDTLKQIVEPIVSKWEDLGVKVQEWLGSELQPDSIEYRYNREIYYPASNHIHMKYNEDYQRDREEFNSRLKNHGIDAEDTGGWKWVDGAFKATDKIFDGSGNKVVNTAKELTFLAGAPLFFFGVMPALWGVEKLSDLSSGRKMAKIHKVAAETGLDKWLEQRDKDRKQWKEKELDELKIKKKQDLDQLARSYRALLEYEKQDGPFDRAGQTLMSTLKESLFEEFKRRHS